MLATDAETIKERLRLAPLLLALLSGERAAALEEEDKGKTAAAAATADERRRATRGDAPAPVRLPFAGQATGLRNMETEEDSIV